MVLKNFFNSKFILIILFSISSSYAQITGNFSQVIEGFNWGPGVTKMIIHLSSEMNYDVNGIDPSAFSVKTTKEGSDTPVSRIITDAFISDENGKPITKNSNYITLIMSCHPSLGETNPFYYSFVTSLNNWANPYTSNITLTSDLTLGTQTIEQANFNININPIKNFLIGIDNVFTINKRYSYNNINLNYAYYKSSNSSNRGVVIWLHGTGEGGTDTTITLYGNKVTNLTGNIIQKELNDCDILVVQCPSRWLNYKTGISTEDSINTIDKYQSNYTEILYNLIKNYVLENNISSNRIYIGGASNGGSMTMNMLLNYPDYFAAAYFASEGYADRHITDLQIQTIKNIPLWFVYAEGDQTNDPLKTTKATYDRLIKANAPNVHLSYYPNGVVDISGNYKNNDGTPYQYSAHWSWVYLLDNDCKDNDDKLFAWLGKQKKADNSRDDISDSFIYYIKLNSFIILLFFFI